MSRSPHPSGEAQSPHEASGWRVQGCCVDGVLAAVAGVSGFRAGPWRETRGDEALRASGCAAVGGQVLGRGALWHGPPWELSPREPRQDLPVPPIHGLSPHGALPGVLRARAQVAGCLRSSHQGRGWPMLGQVGWGQTEGRDGEEG